MKIVSNMTYDKFLETLEYDNHKDWQHPSDRFTDNINILRLKNEMGWTIAHAQSIRGWTTDDQAILKWATKDGYTVAHAQAFRGHVFTSDSINKLTTKVAWLPTGKDKESKKISVEQLGKLGNQDYAYMQRILKRNTK